LLKFITILRLGIQVWKSISMTISFIIEHSKYDNKLIKIIIGLIVILADKYHKQPAKYLNS